MLFSFVFVFGHEIPPAGFAPAPTFHVGCDDVLTLNGVFAQGAGASFGELDFHWQVFRSVVQILARCLMMVTLAGLAEKDSGLTVEPGRDHVRWDRYPTFIAVTFTGLVKHRLLRHAVSLTILA